MLDIRFFLALPGVLGMTAFLGCSSELLRKPTAEPLKVTLEPVGVDDRTANHLLSLVMERGEVRTRLEGSRYRILRSEFGGGGRVEDPSRGSSWVQLEVYDYTHDRLLIVSGDPGGRSHLQVDETADQPPPTQDEIDEAIASVKADPYFGSRQKEWMPSPAMPGVVSLDGQGVNRDLGRHLRVITLGLIPKQPGFKHEIVGVDLNQGKVIRFPSGAPPTAIAAPGLCAPPSAHQPTSNRYVPGQSILTVQRGDSVIWKMQVIRPSASSGARGSGIDLRGIEYQGKKVLSQLHVPILNVRYGGDVCGPFRDWQFMEGAFHATGKVTSEGFLAADAKPMTILDSGNDLGNYRGVVVYTEGNETVLVTEMESGWYRYKNEYRFGDDGTIRPSWGFAAVQDSCVCNSHLHHAFWRMNFELGDGKHNQVQYFDGNSWKPVTQEAKFFHDSAKKLWRVVDLESGRGYEVVPSATDGTALNDRYSSGDVWALKYEANELDDHGDDQNSQTLLDGFLNGANISDSDVVLWYGGHLLHRQDSFNPSNPSNHPIGPVLRPIQWDR